MARFGVQYGDDSLVEGRFGYQDVTIGGITVKKQVMALANELAYPVEGARGDGVTSGLLGLAYPILVRAVNATSSSKATGPAAHVKYDPVFTSMQKQGLVSPAVFSVAMDRKTASGYLAFGGLPPVAMSSDFAKTPIRIVSCRVPHGGP